MPVSLLVVPKQGKKQGKATRLTSNMCNEKRGQKDGWRRAIHDVECKVHGLGSGSKVSGTDVHTSVDWWIKNVKRS